MGRKSAHGLPPGIQLTGDGFYLATLEGDDAKRWRDRHPGRSLPRRRVRSLKEAMKAQRALIDDLKSGRDSSAENPTVSTWVERWIAGRQTIKAPTRRRYTQSYTWQIKPLRIGRLRLLQVTREHVREWVRALEAQPRQDDETATLKPHTIHNAFAVLRAAFNAAVADGLIATNPCQGVELPSADGDEVTPLTPEQVGRLLGLVDAYDLDKATGAYRAHRLAALYHVAIRAGLRQGELLGLRWRDVDLDQAELRIAGQMQRGTRTSGKTKNAHRAVPLSVDLVRVLRAHRRNQVEEQALSGAGWNSSALVFCSENGTPLSASNTWRSFTALQRRAELAETCEACEGRGKVGSGKRAAACAACDGHGVIALFRFHDLRHTYAALSLAAGVSLFTLSRRMGHSSITVTADRYGHLYKGETQDVEAVDRYLKRA